MMWCPMGRAYRAQVTPEWLGVVASGGSARTTRIAIAFSAILECAVCQEAVRVVQVPMAVAHRVQEVMTTSRRRRPLCVRHDSEAVQ